jgi:prepilin peptidase CpaA
MTSYGEISSVMPLPAPLAAALAALVAAAAFSDLRSRTIPNWLVVAGLAVAVGGSIYFGRVFEALLGFGLASLVYLAFYALRAMGGGDVKLMAAVGAIAGPSNWFIIFIFTAIFGCLAALGVLIWNGGLAQALRNLRVVVSSLGRGVAPYTVREELDVASPSAVTLPHGIAIALGTLLFLFGSA